MRIIIHDTTEQLNAEAALFVAGQLLQQPDTVLGLATGSSPMGLYHELVKLHQRGLVSFAEATTFNLDEYAGLPKNHPESYSTYMHEHLFSKVDIKPGHTHIPNGEAADLLAECERYDRQLANAGQIDLQILGIGNNGHIGFNEPAPFLVGGTHLVRLHEQTRRANARFFASLEEVPMEAITMGIVPILKAKSILLIASGENKADIVGRSLTGTITTECPASLLQTHPNLTVMVDQAAGEKLRPRDMVKQ